MTRNLRSVIQSFKYDGGEETKTKAVGITRNASTLAGKNRINKANSKKKLDLEEKQYRDLAPSIKQDLSVLFIGYNPGLESSIQQHHYAHFTNLFYKLLNQSEVLIKVLKSNQANLNQLLKEDELFQELVEDPLTFKTRVKPVHDFDLIKYDIGFTDLVLRCTRTAQELSMKEKLENVPRLLSEFKETKTKHLVFIGKGIWEIIVKYMCQVLNISKFKLTKENFVWGLQNEKLCSDLQYRKIIAKMTELSECDNRIYVFPNTSGLVTSLTYHEKLQLWNNLGNDILTGELKK